MKDNGSDNQRDNFFQAILLIGRTFIKEECLKENEGAWVLQRQVNKEVLQSCGHPQDG